MVTLITGVPGWLGSRLLSTLAGDEEEVRCLVQDGLDPSLVNEFTQDIVMGDVRKPSPLKKALLDIDTVFHLAGVIHPRRTRDFYGVNTQGTKNMIDASLAADVERFIYVSSDTACGQNIKRDRPMTEEDSCRPAGHYGKSKFLAEQAVNHTYEEHGLKTTILRPCWFYGPGQPARMTMLMKMIAKGIAPVFGGGLNLRSMAYIDNVVSALLLARGSRKSIGETYWIADERPYPTVEIYQTIAGVLGVRFRPLRLPSSVSVVAEHLDRILRKGGVNVSKLHVLGELRHDITCSIEKAKRELNYSPRVALQEGMEAAVAWNRARGAL